MSFSDTLAEALLSTSSDAIIAADKEGIIRFWNPGAERIFGYASGAAIGQSLDIIIPERLRKRHWDGYYRVIKSGESRYGHGDILAVPAVTKDGVGVSIEFTIVPLRDGVGRAVRIGGDHARRYQALRGDSRAEAEARGSDEGSTVMRRSARSHASSMPYRFFTIGHSTRSIGEFVDLLSKVEVQLVVDVRTVPRSRTNPQYNSDVLPKTLSESQIAYQHIAALGGLRGRRRDVLGGRERVLAESEVSQLRGLRHERGLPFRPDQAARIGACYAVRNHVCGGRVVAMSSADHRRLSDCCRRDGIPHSRAGSHRAGADDGRSQMWTGWSAHLSGNAAERLGLLAYFCSPGRSRAYRRWPAVNRRNG